MLFLFLFFFAVVVVVVVVVVSCSNFFVSYKYKLLGIRSAQGVELLSMRNAIEMSINNERLNIMHFLTWSHGTLVHFNAIPLLNVI